MNPNRTPTSRRNRPDTPQPQQDPELGFQPFAQQGYRPQFSQQIPPQISQQYPPQWSQQNPPQYFYNSLGHPQQIPYQLTRPGLIDQGFTPANFNPPSPFINLADDIVPETQHSSPHTPQSIYTQPSNPQPSNPRPTRKGKNKQYENRAPKQMWTKEEELHRATSTTHREKQDKKNINE